MSHVRGVHECDCACHHSKGMLHSVPCCDGRCPRCGQFIDRGRMKAHEAEHLARIKGLIEELGPAPSSEF